MKNLLLSHLALFSLIFANTCSVNDDVEYQRSVTDNTLTVTINDVDKTFNTISIIEQSGDSDNNILDIIKIEASIDNLPDEVLKIDLFKDNTGDDVIYNIKYIKNDLLYYLDYSSNVQDNDDDDLSFDFSGNVWKHNQSSQEKEIEFVFTEGELTASR